MNNLGNVYDSQGRWEDAIAQYEQSLEICRSLGDRHGEGQTLSNLGEVYQSQGRWEDAIAQYEQSLEINRSLGDRHGEGQSLSNLGMVYQSQGRWEDAIAQYEQSLEISRSLGDRHGEGLTLRKLRLSILSPRSIRQSHRILASCPKPNSIPDSPEAKQIAQQLQQPYPICQMVTLSVASSAYRPRFHCLQSPARPLAHRRPHASRLRRLLHLPHLETPPRQPIISTYRLFYHFSETADVSTEGSGALSLFA